MIQPSPIKIILHTNIIHKPQNPYNSKTYKTNHHKSEEYTQKLHPWSILSTLHPMHPCIHRFTHHLSFPTSPSPNTHFVHNLFILLPRLNRQIPTHSPSRQPNPLLLIERSTGVISLDELRIHALRLSVNSELVCLINSMLAEGFLRVCVRDT